MTHTRAIYSPSRQAVLLANDNGYLELDIEDAAQLGIAIAEALATPCHAAALLGEPVEVSRGTRP